MRGSASCVSRCSMAPVMAAHLAAEGPATPKEADTETAATDPADAEEADAEKPPDKKASTIEITGFVDAYYGYNFNDPPGDTQLRNFDTKHDQLSLDLIEVALEQKPTSDSRLGFRTDLNFGPVTDMVHAYEPGGAESSRPSNRPTSAAWRLFGKGLQIDFGKFVTPHGPR